VENFSADYCFDIIIARAFSSLTDFLQKTRRLCCRQGQFLAMKGVYPTDELAAISAEYTAAVQPLHITGLNAQRHVVCITCP
jgi:16S rRNA (guanine527-N7)-methyltransferase